MSSTFRIQGLSKSYGSNLVVDDLDIEVEQGEFLVLLGPSGCGKTTTLRCLAGLETPEKGRIDFASKTVFDAADRVNIPAHKRDIGMVFQSYALWPHMTVQKNIAYPLKVRKMKDALSGGQVEKAAEMVDCGHLLGRLPAQLSGGQQQRVALARGLVARPELVLFDEPLSNLDARLRGQVRTEIHRLHEALGFTAVFVTHDQSEAFALGDKLAIMRDGKIDQLGSPREVFERPATEYVANFIGLANRLELTYGNEGWETSAGVRIPLPRDVVSGDRAVARLRPDDVDLVDPAAVPEGSIALSGELLSMEYEGRHYDIVVRAAGTDFRLSASAAKHGAWLRDAEAGQPAVIGFSAADMHVYEAALADSAAA